MFANGDIVTISRHALFTETRFGKFDKGKQFYLGKTGAITLKSKPYEGVREVPFVAIYGWHFCYEDITFQNPEKEAYRKSIYDKEIVELNVNSILFDVNQLVLT
jgi:hypothetical protein